MSAELDRALGYTNRNEDETNLRENEEKNKDRNYEKLFILGSLVPDLVLNNLREKVVTFQAVLLMADVSGFTELCDKYSKNSIRASSQITEIINIYMGEMVRVIYEYKGDVVNYSGDAILALWKIEEEKDDWSAFRACECSIYIQDRIGEYVTQVNTLRVKLTITSGDVYYLMVGDESKRDFIILGQGIMDLKKTEKYSKAGLTVMTMKTISAGMRKKFKFESLVADEIFKLVGFKIGSTSYGKFNQERGMCYLIGLRPILKSITDEDAKIIKLFMMNAVNIAIKMTGKVEHMTEMRNVVIVFINIITDTEAVLSHLARVIENCYLTISHIVISMEGAVNKFSLFDKDLMFLVIFGLRYYKGSVTEKTALKCAGEIKTQLEKLVGVTSVSIGITSGTVYCGVVGHPVRREFTVIGLKVNMAARLMVAYEHKIVCDRETFLHSRIDYKNFVLQEPKYLKGISNVGPIYMYGGQDKDENILLRTSTNLPLLGRDKEMELFDRMIVHSFLQHNPHSKSVIAYIGESGRGKTRLLEEIRIKCQDQYLCIPVDLRQHSLDTPYSGFQEICEPLGLSQNLSVYERELRLYNLLKGGDYNKEFICLLNKVFNVKFGYTPEYYNSNGQTKELNLRKIVILIMKRLTVKPTVLIIDNAEYMDKISWLLLYDITMIPQLITVLGIGTKAELFPFAKDFITMNRVIRVILSRIDEEYFIGLACQMLSVDAIPYEVLLKIHKNSEGNPGWIEGFLLICIQTGYLYYRDDKTDILLIEKLVKAPRYMLERGHNITMSKIIGRVTGMSMDQSEYDTIKACLIEDDFNDEEILLNRESKILTGFYACEPYVKQILKFSAAFGDLIPREGLQHLLGETLCEKELCSAVKTLFERKIFGCATKTHSYDLEHKCLMRKRLLNYYSDERVECFCQLPDNIIIYGPKYAHCDYLRFISREFKNSINDLLTHAEKKEYHSKIVTYFLNADNQCSACKSHESRWKYKGMENVFHHVKLFTDQDWETPGKMLIATYAAHNQPDKFGRSFSNICVIRTIRFSYVNLSDCRCHIIMLKINELIIHHCLEGDMIEAAINLSLDNVLLYLTLSDVVQASIMIEKIAGYLKTVTKMIKEPYIWKIGCTKGILNLLRGLCKFSMGHTQEAVNFYQKTLNDVGCIFPQTKWKIKLETIFQYVKMKHTVIHGQCKFFQPNFKNDRDFLIFNIITETLNFMAQSYIVLRETKYAALSALWAFNKAFKLRKYNFFNLAYAVGNVLYLTSQMDVGSFYHNLREFAEKLALVCVENASLMELRGILHLYRSLVVLSVSKGDLEDAIEYCHVALSISLPVQEFETKLRFIPRMIIIYVLQLELKSALSKLVEYESIMNLDVDSSSRIWYIAVIMFIRLYCGIALVSYQDAKQFIEKGGPLTVVKDLESEIVLKCCMWLFSLRRKQWAEARYWIPSALDEKNWNQPYSTTINIILFEGLLLQYSRIDNENKHLDLIKKINHFDKKIAKVIDVNLMWKPRYLHLSAYKLRLDSVKQKSKWKMAEAQIIAESQGNKLEELSILSDKQRWLSQGATGHDLTHIEPVTWKGKTFGYVTVYNLPLDDPIF